MEPGRLPAALVALLAVTASGCVGDDDAKDAPHTGITTGPCLTSSPCLAPWPPHTGVGPCLTQVPHTGAPRGTGGTGGTGGPGTGGTGAGGSGSDGVESGGTGRSTFLDRDEVLRRLPDDVARRLVRPS